MHGPDFEPDGVPFDPESDFDFADPARTSQEEQLDSPADIFGNAVSDTFHDGTPYIIGAVDGENLEEEEG